MNQDAFIVLPNFMDKSNFHLFAVCDGHGKYGQDASSYVKRALPLEMMVRIDQGHTIEAALSNSFKHIHA